MKPRKNKGLIQKIVNEAEINEKIVESGFNYTLKDIEEILDNLNEFYDKRRNYIIGNREKIYSKIYLMLQESLDNHKKGSNLFPSELLKAFLSIDKVI